MEKLRLSKVRCFRTSVEATLAPITLLVGENSTGKSSFLALLRASSDLAAGRTPNFNIDPFELGSYDSIAHYHGGQGKRAQSFRLGVTRKVFARAKAPKTELVTVDGTFVERDGQPRLSEWKWRSSEASARVSVDDAGKGNASLTVGSETIQSSINITGSNIPLGIVLQSEILGSALSRTGKVPRNEVLTQIDLIAQSAYARPPYSIAPIRTRPSRTYDPVRDQASPEGQHIPVILSQLSARKSTEWRSMRGALQDFGKSSGLFSSLDIRHLGKRKASEPFQVEVELHEQQGKRNIIDVGYGVSQVLPILVECLVQPLGTILLVQQPEVHLHPRAQAELGTFLAKAAKGRDLQVVLESHSDYLIDRVAMAIRERLLSKNDVSLLFFEPANGEVRIRAMSYDEHGNIVDAPDAYRSFFLREQARYLGVDSVSDS